MIKGILHLHLLMALIFAVALWRAQGVWARIAAGAGAILVVTGLYNLTTRLADAAPLWYLFIGIKILVGLHAIAMSFLLARGAAPEKVARFRNGGVTTAIIAILIGLYLSNFARLSA